MNAIPSADPDAKKARQRGMALTIVLIMMVLFATLATAIFLTASAERQNSSLFAAGIEAKQLIDTSLNLCIQFLDTTEGEFICLMHSRAAADGRLPKLAKTRKVQLESVLQATTVL